MPQPTMHILIPAATVERYRDAYERYVKARAASDAADAKHQASEYRGEDNILRYTVAHPVTEHSELFRSFEAMQRAERDLLSAIRLATKEG